jgi:hypothetical protein
MAVVSKTGSQRKEEFKCDYCEMVFSTEEVCVKIRIYLKRGAKCGGKEEGGREGERERAVVVYVGILCDVNRADAGC